MLRSELCVKVLSQELSNMKTNKLGFRDTAFEKRPKRSGEDYASFFR